MLNARARVSSQIYPRGLPGGGVKKYKSASTVKMAIPKKMLVGLGITGYMAKPPYRRM